ncbi:MAG: shikimate kinase [Gemmatimonadota bacterium]
MTTENGSRILIFGNSGSGKSTMAAALARVEGLAHLDLDQLAWDSPGVRKPLAESSAIIQAFITEQPEWVVEGCYGDILEIVLPFCTELRFLNPGVDTCIANCLARPWEPEKYASKEDQDRMLDFLLNWVREYETRDDEYSLRRHREIFAHFPGHKREYTALLDVSTPG